MNELPSVTLTQRFLDLCEQHSSQRLAVRLVAVNHSTSVSGLAEIAWDVGQMRAAVDYVEQMRVR